MPLGWLLLCMPARILSALLHARSDARRFDGVAQVGRLWHEGYSYAWFSTAWATLTMLVLVTLITLVVGASQDMVRAFYPTASVATAPSVRVHRCGLHVP